MTSPHWTLIEDQQALESMLRQLQPAGELAVDLEGEWNCHHYGIHLCLIQIADRQRCFIVDPLAIKDLSPLFNRFADPAVLKVMHSPQCDLLLLDRLYHCHPRNLFDTAKAAQLLGTTHLSLDKLLLTFCGVQPVPSCQADDWFIRPLPSEMLNYAAGDVTQLLTLKDRLSEKLSALNRLTWLQEENRLLERIRFVPEPDPHLKIKGSSTLDNRGQLVLRELFNERDTLAKKLNKPAYFILGNSLMLELAGQPPRNVQAWTHLKSCHPALRRNADQFHQAVQRALKSPLPPEKRKPRKPRVDTKLFNETLELLQQLLPPVQEHYPEIASLILSKSIITKIAVHDNEFVLRDWQKQALLSIARGVGLADKIEPLLNRGV